MPAEMGILYISNTCILGKGSAVMKQIIALLLALCLVIGMIPPVNAAMVKEPVPLSEDLCCQTLSHRAHDMDYTRPSFDGYLYEITPGRVEDTFAYLNEMYIEKHPEAALIYNIADEKDRACLSHLAEVITEGCATNTQKADAIDDWLRGNITYDVQASAYANDTFYSRIGNCMSYANLMQALLRSLGIPAVVGDGWRGNMKTSTVDLFNYDGHAWCFVYLENQWVLYDPLWLDGGTTDREYIAQWIYLDTVEIVTPAHDGENLPPEAFNKPKIYYTDGIVYNYNVGGEYGYGNFTQFVNNQGFNFTTNQSEPENGISDGWYYLDGVSDKSQMKRGEVYRNSWISYGNYADGTYLRLTYAHPNGMQIDGAVMEYDGRKLLMVCNCGYPIVADEEDYTIQYGTMTFKSDYVGPFIGEHWGDYYNTPDHFVVWSSQNPEIATVDDNGILTAVAPGWATIMIQLIRQDVYEGDVEYACLSTTYLDVYISDEVRVPDYSDHGGCEHQYSCNGTVGATCTEWGYEIQICELCGDRKQVYTEEPLGHDYAAVVKEATCTEVGSIIYTCVRCGDGYTEELPIDPQKHAWDGTVCTLCGAEREIPFSDVAEGKYYYDPIVWAYQNNITSGTSASAFSPNDDCTRGQIVTFLWRAEGCPEPTSTNNPFADVDSDDYFYKAVLWAVENGITAGATKTTFNPKGACDRAQVVTFMYRAAGSPTVTSQNNPFVDVPNGKYYHDAVLWAVENGITAGISATKFAPNNTCTRGQIVTFLYRGYAD